jgi:hypothetical protein
MLTFSGNDKTEFSKTLDIVSRRLVIENLQRCANCALLIDCQARKDQLITCDEFKPLQNKNHLIIASLADFEKLRMVKDQKLLSLF